MPKSKKKQKKSKDDSPVFPLGISPPPNSDETFDKMLMEDRIAERQKRILEFAKKT